MRLCVNNSWSASHVVGSNYGNYMWGYKDNMLGRATQLHRDITNKNPDVIFVFMSTNDLLHPSVSNFGTLYNILMKEDGRTDAEKIEAWFAPVAAAAEKSTSITPFKSWDEAYALSLKAMSEKYTEAEIFCMTLLPNTNGGYDKANRDKFNRVIPALAEYFGITTIDINQGGIDSEHLSTTTVDGLHPNIVGFADIEKTIIKTLYKKLMSK
jgi:lysophospholipase L1-like esterase